MIVNIIMVIVIENDEGEVFIVVQGERECNGERTAKEDCIDNVS